MNVIDVMGASNSIKAIKISAAECIRQFVVVTENSIFDWYLFDSFVSIVRQSLSPSAFDQLHSSGKHTPVRVEEFLVVSSKLQVSTKMVVVSYFVTTCL